MRDKTKIIAGSAGLTAIIAIIGLATSTLAWGNGAQNFPNFDSEKFEATQQAFENDDYNAWKEIMSGRGRITEIINEENFPKFSQMHQLMQEGNFEEANAIREELGLKPKSQLGPDKRFRKGMGNGFKFVDQNGDGFCDRMEQ